MSKIIGANQRKFSFFIWCNVIMITNKNQLTKTDYTIHPYGALGLQQNELSFPLFFYSKIPPLNPSTPSLFLDKWPNENTFPFLSPFPFTLLFQKEILSLHSVAQPSFFPFIVLSSPPKKPTHVPSILMLFYRAKGVCHVAANVERWKPTAWCASAGASWHEKQLVGSRQEACHPGNRVDVKALGA